MAVCLEQLETACEEHTTDQFYPYLGDIHLNRGLFFTWLMVVSMLASTRMAICNGHHLISVI